MTASPAAVTAVFILFFPVPYVAGEAIFSMHCKYVHTYLCDKPCPHKMAVSWAALGRRCLKSNQYYVPYIRVRRTPERKCRPVNSEYDDQSSCASKFIVT